MDSNEDVRPGTCAVYLPQAQPQPPYQTNSDATEIRGGELLRERSG